MENSEFKTKKLLRLFVPIFFETFFLMLAGMSDTLMLSNVSDDAVGAVGTANTYIGLFFILFAVISSGLIAVMTQYIGSGKKGVAYQARQAAIVINGVIGLTLAITLALASGPIIDALGVALPLRHDAALYLHIVGAGCLFDALIPVFSCYLRAFDKSRYSLIAALSGNVVNVVFNALLAIGGSFLFGMVLKMGVFGIYIALSLDECVRAVFMIWRWLSHKWENKVLIKHEITPQNPAESGGEAA